MTKEVAMKIKAGDRVDFVYEGVRLNGYVYEIHRCADGDTYFNIKCNDMEFNTIPYYSVLPANHPEEKFFFDTDLNIIRRSEPQPYPGSIMKDAINKNCTYINYDYIKNDKSAVKDILNSYYGGYRYMEKQHRSIKAYQTEIKSGERKGLYTTVIFRYLEPIVVKKDADAANDTLIAIAYAYAKHKLGSNSHFKKRIDEDTVKIGKDYVVNLWSDFFVPGEILKRKRWDIYTYVAVQDLFKRFSTKDIIDAVNNVTYTVKEK